MATTKRKLVLGAYEEMGLANYVFDLTPEELQSGLYRLDEMMAEWDGIGITLGYSFPANPDDSDLDDEAGIPDTAISAVRTNLAVLLAPSKGKTLPVDTKVAAKRGYDRLLTASAQIPQMQYPNNLPLGAGNKRLPNDQQYFQPKDPITVGNADVLDLGEPNCG